MMSRTATNKTTYRNGLVMKIFLIRGPSTDMSAFEIKRAAGSKNRKFGGYPGFEPIAAGLNHGSKSDRFRHPPRPRKVLASDAFRGILETAGIDIVNMEAS